MIDWNDEAGHFSRHWSRLADPARHAIADAVALGPGMRVLDVGCGSGDFCALALARGARPSGIDAAPEMIAIARGRAPEADLRVASMERMPYDDDAFDLVTGFNSLQFADDPEAALREWIRVGDTIAVCAWADRGRCEVDVVEARLRELGGTEAGPPFGPRIDGLARGAGLEILVAEDLAVPYEVADQEELEVAFLLDARGWGALDAVGETASRAAIAAAAAPFRRHDGSYRFENVFRCVVSRASAAPAAT
jgi:SAM-dependent methyltransferase